MENRRSGFRGNQGSRNEGGGFRGGHNQRRGGFRGSQGPREMHKAVCGDCGKECEVPFKPSEDRPVYCRDCFAKHRDDNPRGPSRRSPRYRDDDEDDE